MYMQGYRRKNVYIGAQGTYVAISIIAVSLLRCMTRSNERRSGGFLANDMGAAYPHYCYAHKGV